MRKLFNRHAWIPWDPTAGYVAPHIITLCLLALLVYGLGFASGWYGRTVYDARYWRTHYTFPGLPQTPNPRVAAPIQDVRRVGLPALASIQISRYPGVGDQDGLGACAAWASAWVASYEYRLLHNDWIRFSPRYEYDHYSLTYNRGQDGGSWPDQDLETLSTTGIPLFKQLPEPPYLIDQQMPSTDAMGGSLASDALRRRTPFQMHILTGFTQGAGQGAVDAVRSTIYGSNGHDGHPVLIALPVYPEYDQATQQPLIVSPAPGEYSRGGHENVILAYDDTKVFPDGTMGGVLVQNQWTVYWGNHGRAWLSYDFLRRFSFGLEYVTLGTSAPRAGRPPQGRANPKSHLTKPPFDPGTRVGATAASSWYVHGVHLYNRAGQPSLTGLINAEGDRYHVWPVAIAATIGTESAFNPYAERWAGGLDNSCGLMQQIITNVYGRIGYVGPQAACRWEETPGNSVDFGTEILHQNDVYHGGRVVWPYAYVMYNAGAGLPDGAYYSPSGEAASNFYNNFLPWWRYSLAVFAGGPPPPPPAPRAPFPVSRWCAVATAHHTACPSYRYRGFISGIANSWRYGKTIIAGCGAARDEARWDGHNRVSVERFVHCRAYGWPDRRQSVKWVKA